MIFVFIQFGLLIFPPVRINTDLSAQGDQVLNRLSIKVLPDGRFDRPGFCGGFCARQKRIIWERW